MTIEPTPPTDEPILAKLRSLKLELSPEINYRLPNLFPQIEGWFVNGPIKKRAELIRAVEPTLKQLLNPQEEVLFIARGLPFSIPESFMGPLGLVVMLSSGMYNQVVFVLTNARLLMLHLNWRWKLRKSCWLVYYSEIHAVDAGWIYLTLKLEDDRNLTFGWFSRVERRTMKDLIQRERRKARASGLEPFTTQSREALCSSCFEVVPWGEFECEACGTTFWKPSELALRSLIFPSSGEFLLGHYLIVVLLLVYYFLGLLICVVPALIFMTGNQVTPVRLIGALVVIAAYLVFAHAFAAAVTYMIARKGLNPLSGPTSKTPLEAEET